MTDNSIFSELKKRRVIQVAAVYGVVAWGVTEIVVTIVEQLYLPEWVSTIAVIAFVVGFPIAMFLSWTFDITPDGIQRTEVSSRRGKASIAGAMTLLVVFTAALFLLIQPNVNDRRSDSAPPNSIAVLPFDNASAGQVEEYVVNGLSDELRDQLGLITGVQMAARSSSIAAVQQSVDAQSRAASLGVSAIIEGSVRARGGGLRISIQLVDGQTGIAMLNQSYDSSAGALLGVQRAIVEGIVQKLLPEHGEVTETQATRNDSANELMLLARHYEQQVREQPRLDEELLQKAIDYYEQATEADPNSALAYARLANSLMYGGNFYDAEAPIFRARALDPENSEVQNITGRYYWSRGIEGAGIAFKRAVDLNPNNADALSDYAYWLWMQGNTIESMPYYERALELDPLSLARLGAMGDFFANSSLVDQALEIADRVEQNFDSAASYRLIARIMELVGQVDKGVAWTIRARNKEPDNQEHVQYLAELYVELGDYETALALEPEPGVGLLYKMRRYEELIDIGEFLMIDQPNDLELRYVLAYAYLVTGQAEAAVRVLRSTGLPDTVFGETRQPSDMEAFVTLIDALDAIGERSLAQQMAAWFESRTHYDNANWWIQIYRACPLAINGHDEEALRRIGNIAESPRLPWNSLIRDMRCLQPYSDNPRYTDMIETVDERRASLLAQLPRTLVEYGVSL